MYKLSLTNFTNYALFNTGFTSKINTKVKNLTKIGKSERLLKKNGNLTQRSINQSISKKYVETPNTSLSRVNISC